MSDTVTRIPLRPTAWALSAAFVATFVVCAGFELIASELPVAHGWVDLFTIRPITSVLGWIEGIIGSVVFGWFFASIATWVFNSLSQR